MTPTRRAFTQAAGAVAAAILSLLCCELAIAERASDAPEPVVLARATSVVLDASETHVVLAPVPPPRRPQPKSRPKTKGAKPAQPQMQLVLRDVVAREGAPAYEVFLVLEGPNVFEATTTRVQVGTLEPSGDDGGGDVTKRDTVAFNANDAFAQFAKIRGFNIRHIRVVVVRRAVKDEQGKETVPPDPMPPDIGAIELVRS